MSPRWIATRIVLPASLDLDGTDGDLLSGVLTDLGAEGLELKDTTPPEVVASFEDPPKTWTEAFMQGLRRFEPASVSFSLVPDVDWSNHWKQHFEPRSFGKLWVVPSWLEAPAGAEHVLWVDPSRAFGTGLHATTALCLERVVELAPRESVLDVGTGTGILALAAKLLGADRVVGTDNDPDALEVAVENATKNQLEVTWTGKDVAEMADTFDLVVANILAGPLIEMASALTKTVKPDGRLILSGILQEQAAAVVKAYASAGLHSPQVTPREEWVRIELSA